MTQISGQETATSNVVRRPSTDPELAREKVNAQIAEIAAWFTELARAARPLMAELGRAFTGTILPTLEVVAQVRREQHAVRGRAYVRRLRSRRSGRR